ncbi:hypothetical protein GCM10027168_10140 [Streptomyces capparidis]
MVSSLWSVRRARPLNASGNRSRNHRVPPAHGGGTDRGAASNRGPPNRGTSKGTAPRTRVLPRETLHDSALRGPSTR